MAYVLSNSSGAVFGLSSETHSAPILSTTSRSHHLSTSLRRLFVNIGHDCYILSRRRECSFRILLGFVEQSQA